MRLHPWMLAIALIGLATMGMPRNASAQTPAAQQDHHEVYTVRAALALLSARHALDAALVPA
jgi:hypothetical protein